ncbi:MULTISPECIES: hypothetical protein [Sorangium]|uniref:Uncharacterized protein n=1 Tax=Sorangium cellulosum TaxID=56 RepID=A0A4P2QHF8_SORCE|nr:MULTISPECIES: hypothetical protein [Sorangium]AUX28978.1 uncharacterized protein SOCE836_010630 [Sorangium cellulosum]WCQ88372.1 hypothetical protein NQZ70_01048 [Sorangium sp. Soce836]
MVRQDLASHIPLVVAAVFATLPGMRMAAAQVDDECSRNLASCDLQERKTHLRAQLWSGACDPSQWDALPRQGYPIERVDGDLKIKVGPRAPVHFLNGVCEAHRRDGDVDHGLHELEKAATVGLLPAQRSAAALFEGLLHCRKLAELEDRYQGELTTRLAPREAFCMHRGMAKASFTRVRWEGLEMSYDTSDFSLTGHAERMAQCYEEYLHGGYDATCGVVSSPSPAAIDAAAETVSRDILADYFGTATEDAPPGDRAIPPLKAMLARKIEMADSSLRDSAALLDGLVRKKDLLVGSYEGIASMFCLPGSETAGLCSGPLPSAVARLHEGYERAVLRSQTILDFVDRWVGGLYEVQGRDVRGELQKSHEGLRDMLARAELPAVPNEMTLLEKLDLMKRDMALLADRSAVENDTLKRQCSIYFCEIRNRNRTFFTNACNQVDATAGRPVKDVNALCAADVAGTVVSGAQTAAALCAGVGLPASYVSNTAMTARAVDTCMSEFHP